APPRGLRRPLPERHGAPGRPLPPGDPAHALRGAPGRREGARPALGRGPRGLVDVRRLARGYARHRRPGPEPPPQGDRLTLTTRRTPRHRLRGPLCPGRIRGARLGEGRVAGWHPRRMARRKERLTAASTLLAGVAKLENAAGLNPAARKGLRVRIPPPALAPRTERPADRRA